MPRAFSVVLADDPVSSGRRLLAGLTRFDLEPIIAHAVSAADAMALLGVAPCDLLVVGALHPDHLAERLLERVGHDAAAPPLVVVVPGDTPTNADDVLRALRGGAWDYVGAEDVTRFAAVVERALDRVTTLRAILPADAGELQARRARDQIRLQGMQKMEAVGRLAGGIAHDFNNIVQAIGGYSELLQESLSAEDPRRETVDEILRAGDRAAALTRQLLAFSRQQVMQPRVLDLNEVVGTVESLLRRLIGEDVTLVARLSPELWSVRADPMQLEQVLMNLVVNARDAMPSGGSITIETDNASLDPVVRHRRLQRDARPLRAPVGDRHRPGHAARRARPRLRALLHHQGAGPRHRPRAVDGLRHRQADRRLHLDRLGSRGRAPASASTCRATRRRRCGWSSGRRRGPASGAAARRCSSSRTRRASAS